MEVECAKVLWGRSEANFKLRYSTMLTDGDSKSFVAICEENIYGVDKQVVKEECINLISKRMGTDCIKETCGNMQSTKKVNIWKGSLPERR